MYHIPGRLPASLFGRRCQVCKRSERSFQRRNRSLQGTRSARRCLHRSNTLEHYWQIYWASYWNSRSKQFTVPVNPVTGSNVDP